ncbi:MAG: cytochrome b/b6 domain-containing protein [Gammaproteobacteria bacterium]
MQLLNTAYRYGWVARILHWTSVTLVAWLFLGISGLDVPPKVYVRDSVVANHAACGLALLGLMGLRLAWRLTNPDPMLRYRFAPWRRVLARGVHRSLYIAVIGECLFGIVALAATGAPLPLVGPLAGADASLAGAARAWHDGLASALLLLVLVHAGAGVTHQVADVVTPAPPPD